MKNKLHTIAHKKYKTLVKYLFIANILVAVIIIASASNATNYYNPIATNNTEEQDSIKNQTAYEKTFTNVEKGAEFPGGSDGWKSYLEKNLTYPRKAMRKNTEGVVKIQLTVSKNGDVINAIIMSDPGDGLGEEALRIIEKGPKWVPATQNGRNVTYRFTQSITFKLN
jgi:TonB family protein